MKITQFKTSYLLTNLFFAVLVFFGFSARSALATTVSCTSNINYTNINNGDDVTVLSGNTCTSISTEGEGGVGSINLNNVTINSGGTLTNTTTSGSAYSSAITLLGGVGSFLNNGEINIIIPDNSGAVSFFGAINSNATIANNGNINNGVYGLNITPSSAVSNLIINNSGTISSESVAIILNSVDASISVNSITNTGYLYSSNYYAVALTAYEKPINIESFYNSNTISSNSGNAGGGILVGSSVIIGNFTNSSSGTISGLGIRNNGVITTLVNVGSISAVSGSSGIWNEGGVITALNNLGSISSAGSGGFGILNSGAIFVLNNLQGAGSIKGPLTFTGTLPTNYNIIINNSTSFGRLAVTGGTGATIFGINAGSIVQNNFNYTAVLRGISASNLVNTSGTYGGLNWTLNLEPGETTIWDLCFGVLCTSTPNGPSATDTQQSLVSSVGILQNTFTLQNTVLANSFSYDCNIFGANNVCVSAGGRNTAVQAANGLNNTSGLLIASYRLNKNNSRIGAYVDQNLSVTGPGTVQLGNNTPLIGLFGVWSQRPDGVGAEVKVSAAYGQKSTTVNRQVVGTSEAGSGGSDLISQGAQVIGKYGFAVLPDTVVSPYVGVRYTQNNMGGYTEATSTTVTAPLTYAALNTNATTALAGAEARYRGIPKTTLLASAGVETDTNTANGSYNATNASIGTLTPINFNPNPVRTRPTATLGAFYDVAKNQRLGVTGIYRQEPYQAVSTTTVMATYSIGL